MGSFTVILTVGALVAVLSQVDAAGGKCPPPSKVYSCSPKCLQDYECSHGQVCCSNLCNAKSCAEPGGNQGGGKTSSGGPGVYCSNVKCNSFEVCKMDPATKRMKCVRS